MCCKCRRFRSFSACGYSWVALCTCTLSTMRVPWRDAFLHWCSMWKWSFWRWRWVSTNFTASVVVHVFATCFRKLSSSDLSRKRKYSRTNRRLISTLGRMLMKGLTRIQGSNLRSRRKRACSSQSVKSTQMTFNLRETSSHTCCKDGLPSISSPTSTWLITSWCQRVTRLVSRRTLRKSQKPGWTRWQTRRSKQCFNRITLSKKTRIFVYMKSRNKVPFRSRSQRCALSYSKT